MLKSRNVKIEINGVVKSGKRFATRKSAENWIKKHGGELVFTGHHEYIVA